MNDWWRMSFQTANYVTEVVQHHSVEYIILHWDDIETVLQSCSGLLAAQMISVHINQPYTCTAHYVK